MSNIVFLDYDGVVNRAMWMTENGRHICRAGFPDEGRVNDEQAVAWVSSFCERYGYDIVVSSTWRKFPEWADCLRNAGLWDTVRIVGVTPVSKQGRTQEIADYLSAHPEVEHYLIFDDNTDLTQTYPAHLVLCDPTRGFGAHEYRAAVALHEEMCK